MRLQGLAPPLVDPIAATIGSVVRLAGPAIAHQLLLTLVFMADRALVGRLGPEALASMQVSTTIAWTLLSILGATSIGITAVVTRLVGAGDRKRAAVAARDAVLRTGLAATAVAIVLFLADGALLSLCFPRVAPAVLAQAERYLAVALLALPIGAVEAGLAASLQAAGDTTTPLWAATVANVVNLVASVVLIFGVGPIPALGVAGAALGSFAAFTIQAAWQWRALHRPGSPLPFAAVADAKERRSLRRRFHRVTLPALAERLLYQGGYLGYVALIALLGVGAMAANQAIISIEAMSYQTAEGFGVAASVLVGQHLGRRDGGEGLSLWLSAGLAAAALAGFSLVFLAAPAALLRLFSDDPQVVATGLAPLKLAALSQPIMAFAVVASMALRAAGETKTLLAITAISGVGLRLVATYVFTAVFPLGLFGVWLASTLDWTLHAVLVVAVLLRGRWRHR
ncbi:MAG: MATE family efflux transporter [Polyangiaceae bacterium]